MPNYAAVAILLASCPLLASAQRPTALGELLNQKCAACHQGEKAPAGINFRSLGFDLQDPQVFSHWVRAYDAVDKGVMPPKGQAALLENERALFLRSLSTPLIAHERQRAALSGRSVLRRLNRYEYENTVRDLLSAPWLQLREMLPEDGTLARFNKSGQALDVSHVQMARYMEAAEQALRLVIDATGTPSHSQRYYARDQQSLIRRMSYGPFNNHPERATIPLLGFDAQPDVISGKLPMSVGEKDSQTRDLEAFATTASTYTGNEMHFDGFTATVGGRYQIRLNSFSIWAETKFLPAAGDKSLKAWRPTRNKTFPGQATEPVTLYALNPAREKRLLGSFDVTPQPGVHEMEVFLLPGEQIMPDASRLFRSRPGWVGNPDATETGTPGVAYRWLEVNGPLQTPSLRESYRCLFGTLKAQRDEKGRLTAVAGTTQDASQLLRAFITAAYRRPAQEAEVQRYMKIVQNQTRKPGDLLDGLLAGYTAVLCSPPFLYLEERPGPLQPIAIANRLSYFLWNTAPDKNLLTLASKATLTRRDVLGAQTERLLADQRAINFQNAFLDYWLDLRKVGDTTPDQVLYPEAYLDDLLVESSLHETQLFFRELVTNNLPASNLVDSRFTFLNSHLARHYGVSGVDGIHMRRVDLPANSVRGGLLTQASILKITANGTTTSPVLRGVWIMERILGDPPPPPPPGVPAVEPDTRGATTIRQQLDKHRSIASCASCHNKIDPPGFALESFDVVGAWRDRYRSTDEGQPVQGYGKNGFAFTFRHGQPVDTSGKLADGQTFQNVAELKRALLKDERQIARNLVRQLIAYATGTPAGFADRAEVERILDASQGSHYGVRTLIENVVQSPLFTHK